MIGVEPAGQRASFSPKTDLPHSDATLVKARRAEMPEPFSFFGETSFAVVHHNTALAVARIFGDGTRRGDRVFAALQSHQRFEPRFGRTYERSK